MRPVLHGDAVAAARALFVLPAEDRDQAMALMLSRAEAADCYRRRFARAHPQWGNGSLMAAAMSQRLPPEPPLDDAEYCRCVASVFSVLADRRERTCALSGRS
jgi:hypothetical protein